MKSFSELILRSAQTTACTENSSHRFSLHLGPTGSEHPLHSTATWHQHTSRVTHVCCAGRSRVSTQPARLVRVTVSGHSLLYRDTCYCHLSVLIPHDWWLVLCGTGQTFTDRTFHWSGHFNVGRGWGHSSLSRLTRVWYWNLLNCFVSPLRNMETTYSLCSVTLVVLFSW